MFYMQAATQALNALALCFVVMVGVVVLTAVVVFFVDRFQTSDAVRRNYPVIGRFRNLFSTLGEFFRQYFFAMDREELPFNRAQREWVHRAASGKGNTVAFGSTRNVAVPGTARTAALPTVLGNSASGKDGSVPRNGVGWGRGGAR